MTIKSPFGAAITSSDQIGPPHFICRTNRLSAPKNRKPRLSCTTTPPSRYGTIRNTRASSPGPSPLAENPFRLRSVSREFPCLRRLVVANPDRAVRPLERALWMSEARVSVRAPHLADLDLQRMRRRVLDGGGRSPGRRQTRHARQRRRGKSLHGLPFRGPWTDRAMAGRSVAPAPSNSDRSMPGTIFSAFS